LYAEARGDAYAALGQYEEAGDAYRVALADESQTINRAVVQMKLVDLPAAQPLAAATEDDPMAEPATESDMQEEAGDAE
jgi:hypothetical protein